LTVRRWSAPAPAPASLAIRRNDLRRTYSTWLRADGVPNELSAPTMGHKDTRMLDRVYARLSPGLLRLRLLHASEGAVPVQ
jgi:integrase